MRISCSQSKVYRMMRLVRAEGIAPYKPSSPEDRKYYSTYKRALSS
jgi:hypothetical protein